MTHVLDTDHFSILQRRSQPEYTALVANLAWRDPTTVGVCVVSFHEQVLGAHTYLSRARDPAALAEGYARLERLLTDYQTFPVVSFDGAAATTLAGFIAARVRVAAMDLRIAATALSRGLTVVTRNALDFGRVPGLALEDWTR